MANSRRASKEKDELFQMKGQTSPELLGEQLKVLTNEISIQIIRLPPNRIYLDELILNKSIHFVGAPGTILVLIKDSISIDPISSECTVRFEECSIVLKTHDVTQRDPFVLFLLHARAKLELQDCEIKFDGSRPPCSLLEKCTEEEKYPASVGIHLLGETTASSFATVSACSFLNFSCPILMEADQRLFCTSSTFFLSLTTAILAVNPIELHIDGCSFDSLKGSAIEIRFEKGKNLEAEQMQQRSIKLVNNMISEIKGNGIAVFSENQRDYGGIVSQASVIIK